MALNRRLPTPRLDDTAEISAFQNFVLNLPPKDYPDTVEQFVKILKIYNPNTVHPITSINKIADIVSTFFSNKQFKEDLAEKLFENNMHEDDLEILKIILLNDDLQIRLNITLSETQVEALNKKIRKIIQSPADILSNRPGTFSTPNKNQTPRSTPQKIPQLKDLTALSNSSVHSPRTRNTSFPHHPESDSSGAEDRVHTPSRARSPLKRELTTSESGDEYVYKVMRKTEEFLERLKMQKGDEGSIECNLYYAVDKLYLKCHAKLVPMLRETKDKSHREVMQSKECVILAELNCALEATLDAKKFENFEEKRDAITTFEKSCRQIQPGDAFGRIIGAIVIGLIAFVAVAALSTLIAIAAGAVVPAALLPAVASLFTAGFGWAEATLVAASAASVMTTIGVTVGFFAKNSLQKAVDPVTGALRAKTDAEQEQYNHRPGGPAISS